MTLLIRDEKGKEVSAVNPIITEHNGTTGDTVLLPLTIENTSRKHYHRNVTIQVSAKPPVEVDLNLPSSPSPTIYGPRIDIYRIDPQDKVQFNMRAVVRADTPEQVVVGTVLQVSSLRFPLN